MLAEDEGAQLLAEAVYALGVRRSGLLLARVAPNRICANTVVNIGTLPCEYWQSALCQTALCALRHYPRTLNRPPAHPQSERVRPRVRKFAQQFDWKSPLEA